MTTVYFQDGKPIIDNGSIGISENCCCENPCDCTEFKSLCVEFTFSRFGANVTSIDPLPPLPIPPIINVPGIIAWNSDWYGTNCGTEVRPSRAVNDWASVCDFDGELEVGDFVEFCQRYTTFRLVNSCDECSPPDPAVACCDDGITGNCIPWNDLDQSVKDFLCSCATSSFCKDPVE
jgi:hypothetical protein